MSNPRGQAKIDAARRYRATHPDATRPRSEEQRRKDARRYQEIVAINPCYLKEARAILEGKNTKEKNKCVKLEGD
jgi:hypothetical protein